MITQAVILGLALQTALLLAISLYFRDWTMKFLTLVSAVLLANFVYFTFEGVKGWPSEDTSVVKGVLSSVVIVNPSNEEEGAIYISVFPSTPAEWYEYKYTRKAPKTFYIKYSNDRAAKFEEAKQALIEGKEVKINGIPSENIAEESMPGDAEGIIEIAKGLLEKFIGSQKDTYKPETKDIEISDSKLPPKKENQ